MYKILESKSKHLLIYGLACLWLIYAYHSYFPQLNYGVLSDAVAKLIKTLKRVGVINLLLVGWLWVSAGLIGRRLLRLLALGTVAGVERMVLAVALGLAALSLLVFFLAATKILYKPLGYAVLLWPAIVWFSDLKAFWRAGWRKPKPPGERAGPTTTAVAQGFLWAYMAAVLGVVLLSALGPAIEFDDLAYHLVGPKVYIQYHGLKPIPDILQTFFPKHIEMLFTLGMLLHNEITAKLIHYGFGLLTMLAAYAFAARRFSHRTGLIAAAILTASPLFVWEMRTAHIDLGFALYSFLALYAVLV